MTSEEIKLWKRQKKRINVNSCNSSPDQTDSEQAFWLSARGCPPLSQAGPPRLRAAHTGHDVITGPAAGRGLTPMPTPLQRPPLGTFDSGPQGPLLRPRPPGPGVSAPFQMRRWGQPGEGPPHTAQETQI